MIRNPVLLFLSIIACSCVNRGESQVDREKVHILKDELKNKSLGFYNLDGEFKTLDFHRAVVGHEPPRLAIPSAESMLYEITISDTVMTAHALCRIEAYHKFFSHTFEDCSSLHLDIETGVFSHYRNDMSTANWRFPEYAPQVIPNQGMEIYKNLVYIPHSSYTHNVTEAAGARSFYRETQPILSFRLDDPTATVQALGYFPAFYSEVDKAISDYQPLFCVNKELQCVLSFRYSDSLYIADRETERMKAISCKSNFYAAPDFLSFENAKSMTATRRFEAEASMYLWVKYNPLRNEYYRFCRHAPGKEGKHNYSILVVDAQMNQTAEFIFDGKEYGLVPLVSTETGFMILNKKKSKIKGRHCFESFGM